MSVIYLYDLQLVPAGPRSNSRATAAYELYRESKTSRPFRERYCSHHHKRCMTNRYVSSLSIAANHYQTADEPQQTDTKTTKHHRKIFTSNSQSSDLLTTPTSRSFIDVTAYNMAWLYSLRVHFRSLKNNPTHQAEQSHYHIPSRKVPQLAIV